MSRNSINVHNPLLQLPSAARIQALPLEAREALAALAVDLRMESAHKADKYWKRNKGMTAAYWKAVSIYCLHFVRLCRRSQAIALREAA